MPRTDGSSSGPPQRGGIEIRSPTAIFDDERAIEGLPIRLVIALLVGVAALSVMMTMIDGASGIGKTELGVQLDEGDNHLKEGGTGTVDVTVVDEQGDSVSGAMVTLQGASAQLSGGTQTETSDGDGRVSFEGVTPQLGDNQEQGTLRITIHPPSGDFQDKQDNTEILVTT